jgi:hypothetical protein
MASTLTVMPYMMDPGEDRIVADALYAALSGPGHYKSPAPPGGAPAQVAGDRAVTVQYLRGQGEQKLTLAQTGNALEGTHQGEIYRGTVEGSVHAGQVTLVSDMAVPGNGITWTFRGSVEGDTIKGDVDMGEYGPATWSAVRT